MDDIIRYVGKENENEIPVATHDDGPVRIEEDRMIIQKFLDFGHQ